MTQIPSPTESIFPPTSLPPSTAPSPNVQPLHHPGHEAKVELPQKVESLPGISVMSAQALLVKKMASNNG